MGFTLEMIENEMNGIIKAFEESNDQIQFYSNYCILMCEILDFFNLFKK